MQTERNIWIASLVLCVISVCSIFASCLFGPFAISPQDILSHFFGDTLLNPASALVVEDIRLSRAVLAWTSGAALAASGAVFQGILQNPLADPFTIGVSTGAAFGASVAIVIGATALPFAFGPGLLPLAAMAGALVALAAVIALGRVGGTLRRETVVLAGIVVATFLSALISLLKSLDEESVTGIVFWVMGSFQGRNWAHVQFAAPYIILGIVTVIALARHIDILSMGDSQARMVGLNADRSRLLLLTAASLLTGAAVAVSGVIGFVGLVVPHLIRMIAGSEHRPLIGLSALLGGSLLVWSDILARIILPEGQELPVGVITALFGGPFFCLLLRRKGREASI